MENKQEWYQLLALIKFALGQGETPIMGEDTDWEKIYHICRLHKIQSLVCPGIQKLPKEQQPPETCMKKFQQAEAMEVARDVVQAFSQEELLDAFEQAHIAVLPLKGILMKEFYPRTSMRMMSDLDILFQPGKEKEVETVLTGLGYFCNHKDNHHNIFVRQPYMNVEMHHNLIGHDPLLDAYYDNVWERLDKGKGKSYIYRFRWEDFYIFMLAHLAKHFQLGGCGIRTIVDIRQFLEKMQEQLDWEYIFRELRKVKLEQFECRMRTLVSIWFEGEEETEFYAQLTEFVVKSGIYGTLENLGVQRVARADKKGWKGKLVMWLNLIFMPYSEIKNQYPYLEKYPVLLPVAWVQRFLRAIFLRRGKAKVLLSSMKAESGVVKARQELFEKLGLL